MMILHHAPAPGLGYHDDVYSEDGGQGTAIQTMAPADQGNSGALLLIVAAVLLILMMGEE